MTKDAGKYDYTGQDRNRSYEDRRRDLGEKRITLWVAVGDEARIRRLAALGIEAQRQEQEEAARLVMEKLYGQEVPGAQTDLVAYVTADQALEGKG